MGTATTGLALGIGLPTSVGHRLPVSLTVRVVNAGRNRRVFPDLSAHQPTSTLTLLSRGERHAAVGFHQFVAPLLILEPGELCDFVVGAPLRQLFDQAGPGMIRVSASVVHGPSVRTSRPSMAQSLEVAVQIQAPACFAGLGLSPSHERQLRRQLSDGNPEALTTLMTLPQEAADAYLGHLLPSDQSDEQVDQGVLGALLSLGERGRAIAAAGPLVAHRVAARVFALRKEEPLEEDAALFGALRAAAHDRERMHKVLFRYHWIASVAGHGFDMQLVRGEVVFQQPPPRPGVADRPRPPMGRPSDEQMRSFLMCLARSGVWLLRGSRPALPDEPQISITVDPGVPPEPSRTVSMPAGQWGKGATAELAEACKSLMASG
jgi:hypothetical protein